MSGISTQAEQAGREVHQSEWLDHAARIGLVTYGLVHLVVAWLAVQLALGDWKAGYTAKGVAFGIVGSMFLYAGLTHDPKESGGLDQALHKVLQQPFGPFLLGLIALGLACYGLFCFARARHFND